MTRKEFEEIKERYYQNYHRELHPIIRADMRELLCTLETGGIEDEPVLCIKCGVPLTFHEKATLANYEDWNGNICNDCRKPDENDEPELDDCFFCGSNNISLNVDASGMDGMGDYREWYYPICNACFAQIRPLYGFSGNPAISSEDKRKLAINAWNTRATTPTEPTEPTDDDRFRIFGEQLEKAYREFCNAIIKACKEC